MEDLIRSVFDAALSPFAAESLIVEIPAVFSFIVGILRMFFYRGGN